MHLLERLARQSERIARCAADDLHSPPLGGDEGREGEGQLHGSCAQALGLGQRGQSVEVEGQQRQVARHTLGRAPPVEEGRHAHRWHGALCGIRPLKVSARGHAAHHGHHRLIHAGADAVDELAERDLLARQLVASEHLKRQVSSRLVIDISHVSEKKF